MNKGLLFRKSALAPMLVSAIGAAALIAGASMPRRAEAMKAVPQASPTVKPSIAVTASAICSGSISSTTDQADLPKSDHIIVGFAFLPPGKAGSGNPASAVKAGKTNPVSGIVLIESDASCKGAGATAAQIPCEQGGFFSGGVASGTPETMTLSFQDAPPVFKVGPNVLNGCQMTFSVLPFSNHSGADFITNAAIGGSCPAANTSFVLACTSSTE